MLLYSHSTAGLANNIEQGAFQATLRASPASPFCSSGRFAYHQDCMTPGDFSVWPFRFHFQASDPVFFPPSQAANILRGAFGSIFRELACTPECPGAKLCGIAHTCPYALAFEPRQDWIQASGPSGLADLPRPFVFRALHLDGCRFTPGQAFYFDLILFMPPANLLPHFILVFRQLAEKGLGPFRGRAALSKVQEIPTGELLYDGHKLSNRELPGLTFTFDNPPEPIERLTVRFLTPTELKSGGELVTRPEFPILLGRLRDRISNLRAFYQGGPLLLNFDSLGKQAESVKIEHLSLREIQAERVSSRTGQRHSLGGFTGSVEYSGPLSPFLPFLHAGEWTGVGRQTVWGKGAYGLFP